MHVSDQEGNCFARAYYIYVHAYAHTRVQLESSGLFCHIDMSKYLNYQKTLPNIWSIHQKAVPLQPISQ